MASGLPSPGRKTVRRANAQIKEPHNPAGSPDDFSHGLKLAGAVSFAPEPPDDDSLLALRSGPGPHKRR